MGRMAGDVGLLRKKFDNERRSVDVTKSRERVMKSQISQFSAEVQSKQDAITRAIKHLESF